MGKNKVLVQERIKDGPMAWSCHPSSHQMIDLLCILAHLFPQRLDYTIEEVIVIGVTREGAVVEMLDGLVIKPGHHTWGEAEVVGFVPYA